MRIRYDAALWVLLRALLTTPVAAQAAPDTSAVSLATAAAESWLALVDAGRYEASWDQAAPAFRQTVVQADWVVAVGRARIPFEPFGERRLSGAAFHATLPNAPPGPYVILTYLTAVAGARTVTETVVPMRTETGEWRVSGYFVRPGP